MDDRVALFACAARGGRRVGDDMDFPHRHHIGGRRLIITLSVRTGFRTEFVDTILGANAHATVYSSVYVDENGQTARSIPNYDDWAERLLALPDVIRAAPLVRGQVMASRNGSNAGVEVYGIAKDDLMTIPACRGPPPMKVGAMWRGSRRASPSGRAWHANWASWWGTASNLSRLTAPKPRSGTSPRVSAFEVVYIFTAGAI